MAQNGFAADLLQILLGWLQALFNGVWSLFSGGSGGSLLTWLSDNWIGLLVFFLLFGLITDTLVYLIRWRPFWWWFRKKRLVIDDTVYDAPPRSRKRKEYEEAYVVPSTIVKRKPRHEDDDFFLDDQDKRDVFAVKKRRNHSERDVFSVKSSHTDDPFEISSSRKPARRASAQSRRKVH